MAVGGAVRFVESRLLSRRRVATFLLAGVIALASGSVMAAAAGSRRASASYDRFLRGSHGSDAGTRGVGGVRSRRRGRGRAERGPLAHGGNARREMMGGPRDPGRA